jgi:hypothetical protein
MRTQQFGNYTHWATLTLVFALRCHDSEPYSEPSRSGNGGALHNETARFILKA